MRLLSLSFPKLRSVFLSTESFLSSSSVCLLCSHVLANVSGTSTILSPCPHCQILENCFNYVLHISKTPLWCTSDSLLATNKDLLPCIHIYYIRAHFFSCFISSSSFPQINSIVLFLSKSHLQIFYFYFRDTKSLNIWETGTQLPETIISILE
jgi:hypothetical protein